MGEPAPTPEPAVNRLCSSAAASLFKFNTMLLLMLAGGDRGEPSDVFKLDPPELELVWSVSGARVEWSSRNGLVAENRNGLEELVDENGLVAVSCWVVAAALTLIMALASEALASVVFALGDSGIGWASRSVSPVDPPSRSVPSPPPQGRVSGSPPCERHTEIPGRYSLPPTDWEPRHAYRIYLHSHNTTAGC